MPEKVPELGFYYHYKHDPAGPVGNYAYQVLGVGFHTEDDTKPGEEHFVIYRPLYDAAVYKASKELGVPCFDARPLKMWMGEVNKNSEVIKRFTKVTDPEVVRELERIRKEMYSE